MLSGFFAAALIRAKPMPNQQFKVKKKDDPWALPDPGVKKPLN